ncbi:unnamed protein product [Trichogramma brassicae]|uniref:Integrase catalytic domain-containing protein n=1 Tax=Trichogramma brassicae TaxID=86971 RepID=A0A6H5IDG6_9HYME|nr:unnamed protein product [Trichogramma brassicae]
MKDTEPFAIKSYPVPMKYRDQVSEQIEQMLNYGIIERSTTPFINPLVVVPKKDNSVRLCLDARQINERMVEDHDGSEEIDQVLRRCNKIGVMSSVDLRSSFWQVPLAKESRKYTGFLHQGKTYQYTVVPFGLRISSSALNRAAENVLKGLEKKVIAFVDDWLIISPTIEEHLQDIDELFTRIEKEGVTDPFRRGYEIIDTCWSQSMFLQKLTQLYPIVNATCHITFNRIVDDYFKRFGKVEKIQSDRGSQFTSRTWQAAMKNQGVQVIFSAIRHPQSNIVERYNKEIGRFLRTLVGQNHRTWSVWCSLIAEVINSTINETTGFTPWELHTGKKPERIWTHLVKSQHRHQSHEEMLEKAREQMQRIGKNRADRHNQRAKLSDFQIGELVLVKALRVASSANQTVAKLLNLYEGPYRIHKKVSLCTYEVIQPHTHKIRGRFHITSLKPYFADENGQVNVPAAEPETAAKDSRSKGDGPCNYSPESEDEEADMGNPRENADGNATAQSQGAIESSITSTHSTGNADVKIVPSDRCNPGRKKDKKAKKGR